jgi:methionyl-tRNA synthetase
MTQNQRDIRLQRHCLTNGPIHIGHLGCFVQIFIPLPEDCKEETFCLFAEAMNTVLPFPWRRHAQVIDKYDGIIRKSFLILEFHSTIIQELRLKFITILLQIFHNVVGILSNKSPSNCMTQADQFLADRFVVGTCPKWQRSIWRPMWTMWFDFERWFDQSKIDHNGRNSYNEIETLVLPLDRYEDFWKSGFS